jgi:aspartyl-tRNA(Asn)/glutamyl-tRNA(Gln) amidotransferase subunit B
MQWETVIGLEVHVQLSTKSKIFSGSSTAFGAMPNHQACVIDLGLPGVLPVLNEEAVYMAVKFGLSIGAEIERTSIFDRKNYFYPDLPKGYQISQFHYPIVKGGFLEVFINNSEQKRIDITRAHLEEDAGKSLHEDLHGMTGIDLNRAGTPLLEIVSEPAMRSASEAVAYLKTLYAHVVYLNICDGNMQEGSFRCDANVSVRPMGETKYGTRVEIKNLNSFRFIEKAINYEAERQIDILERGDGEIVQETRLYDESTQQTRSMRTKEQTHDYRYFPDPDLLPVELDDHLIEKIRATLPELPQQKRNRFKEQYGLTDYDAAILTSSREWAEYFEKTIQYAANTPAKLIANWMTGDLAAALNKANFEISQSPIQPEALAGLILRIHDKTISGKMAKTVFESMWTEGGFADALIETKGLKQIKDEALEKIIAEVLQSHPEQLTQYRSGKDKLFGFFVGQVMKASQGQADPQQLNDFLKQQLNDSR